MKRLLCLVLCLAVVFTLAGCGGAERVNPEFQKMTDQYCITNLITEPYLESGEKCAKYIGYIEDSEIPLLEVITLVHSRFGDEVTAVIYEYYYIMSGLGYSAQDEAAICDSAREYIDDNMGFGSISVTGSHFPGDHIGYVKVSCDSVDTESGRRNLVLAGLLENDEPVSFEASNSNLLGDGYIKR
ncbi:MAG: hypothetical protein Q4F17_08585 [Eubacteriales bacterium]|nr:hypothetical protein [Eubacteriales bacterium]